tara:strand:+ start:94 stop:699 length:606 start_codon:yes stop_codon:yes gene_type:complete
MSNYVVGLRGGIGTGKSSVSDLFANKGVVIADADVSARRVVEPGRPSYNAILEHFGDEIIDKNGLLNRVKLREIIFKDKVKRIFVESQTRGSIVQDLLDQIAKAKTPYTMLVLSTGLGKVMGMNRLLVVDAPVELQIKRVMLRDSNTRHQVESIIAAQPSRERRVKDADDLIVNDAEIGQLVLEVEKLHARYLSEAMRNAT